MYFLFCARVEIDASPVVTLKCPLSLFGRSLQTNISPLILTEIPFIFSFARHTSSNDQHQLFSQQAERNVLIYSIFHRFSDNQTKLSCACMELPMNPIPFPIRKEGAVEVVQHQIMEPSVKGSCLADLTQVELSRLEAG